MADLFKNTSQSNKWFLQYNAGPALLNFGCLEPGQRVSAMRDHRQLYDNEDELCLAVDALMGQGYYDAHNPPPPPVE